MGQAQTSSIWDTYEINSDITPRTYRIVHDGTDQVLQLQEENNRTLTLQPRQDQGSDPSLVGNDHWFLLRSGDGFVFKHCRQGTYITGVLLTAASAQSVCMTRYPTTWAILSKEEGGDVLKCAITIPIDQNESWLQARYVGLGVTPGGLGIIPLSEREELDQIWRLERIGDATIEEDYEYRVCELERELRAANIRWSSGESNLKTMRQELETKETELENIREELSNQATELEIVRSELIKQAAELREQYKALDAFRDLLDAKELIPEERGDAFENEIIREKDEEIYQEDGPQIPEEEAVEEAILNEQVTQITAEEPQYQDTNNAFMLNTAVLVPEAALIPEVGMQVVQSPPSPLLDQRLADLGWSFD